MQIAKILISKNCSWNISSFALPPAYFHRLSLTTITFSGTGNATGATKIITDIPLGSTLNSTVDDSSLQSDGTRRDKTSTSISGTGTLMKSRSFVTSAGIKDVKLDFIAVSAILYLTVLIGDLLPGEFFFLPLMYRGIPK